LMLIVSGASAQTTAYGQSTLVAEVPGGLNNVDGLLGNPWGIAFGPRQLFNIAARKFGQVRMYDAAGTLTAPFAFRIPPSAADPTRSRPSGIVFNPEVSDFILDEIPSQFVVVSLDGTVSGWGIDAVGDIPIFALLGRDDSATGAVYTGVAILNEAGSSNVLAIADFHNGHIQTLDTKFGLFATRGNFTDPDLPAGFAPFNIQQIGTQVFVTYALQDAAKHDPVVGAGNGIVDIFDQQGLFVRRFATGGSLNAPWGITVASAKFGAFSNDILISNFGDGTISAFDPTTGNFAGQIKDSDGNVITNPGIRALTFRSDGFGDANTLYFTAGSADGQAGLFGAITNGLVSTTQVTVFPSPIQSGSNASITIAVAAGAGNGGTPTGNVIFEVGDETVFIAPLANGVFGFDEVLSGEGPRTVRARYTGDATFLPSASQTEVQVTGKATTLTLVSSTGAARVGDAVTLTATIHAQTGIPTGTVAFVDGNTQLGASPLDQNGVATLTVSTLAAGNHSVGAIYNGDANFSGSTSAAVAITISNTDFSLAANPPSAAVVAGQSANFMLTVTPAGGFSSNVTFSCAPVTGITCTFNPATVTPVNGAANTTLTVTTSANVQQFGFMVRGPMGPASFFTRVFFLATLALLGFAILQGRKFPRLRASMLTATTVLAIVAISTGLGGCGGAGGSVPANRGTATINVIAQSGNISHTTTVSVTVQ
jgi:uncharacterized protein (TIGR03118 family)